jgi:STE24 endopeptidase
MQRFLLAACAGFVAGYSAVRYFEAWSDLRNPRGPLSKDPVKYGATRRALMVAGFARSLAGHAVVAFALANNLPRRLRENTDPAATAALSAAGTVLGAILDLPLDYAERYALERRYGMTDQKLEDWLRDRAKATVLSLGIGTPLITAMLATARQLPRRWPLIASAAAPPLIILLTLIGPVYIAPIFNKFELLRGPLEERLRSLASRYGVGDAAILRFDMSRQTKKANAYVAGLLGTHRIVVADTLLEGFSEDEIEFVVAHELGHYVARDTWIGVGAGSLAAAILIFGSNFLASRDGEAAGTISWLARFNFFAQLLTALIAPLMAAGSRAIERRADRFALAATQRPSWGIAAFERLRERNLAEYEQPRWAETLIATHPSLKSRIAALREAAAQN